MIFNGKQHSERNAGKGFSLVELLFVIAIIAIVLAFTAPAIQGLAVGTGRKGAVRLVMNSLEEARVTALERSGPVYLGFADKEFPEARWRYRRFVMFRERDPASDHANGPAYIPLSKWIELPQGISIKSEESSIVGSNTGGKITLKPEDRFPNLPEGGTLACIKFSSLGSVELPLPNHPERLLQLFLYEGTFAEGRDTFTRAALYSTEALFDKIVISRFSGKARLQLATTKKRE